MEKFNYRVMTEQRLSEKNYRDLRELVRICNEYDNTDLFFNRDGEEEKITKLLFYNEEKLIGYFGMIRSYNKGEAKVWGTIHPDYRTKDITTEFFNNVIEKCSDNNIKTLRIINERNASSLQEFIISMGGVEKYSTYQMEFNRESYKEEVGKSAEVALSKATLEDLEDIIPIGMEAFGTSEEEERSYNESNLSDSKCSTFIGKFNNSVVGIISVRIKNGMGSIADLAVLKSHRRKGIGRAILSKTIAYLLDQGINKFTLSVETENENALSLYKDSGFRIVKAHDCYELKI